MTNKKGVSFRDKIKNLDQELGVLEKESADLKKTARKIIDRKKIQSVLKKISNT